ncbi:heavy metal-associated isoprenylated plant protein 16-like [Durio zibethinus]|uniref:Heavy metal-associated isoprenylated plant protein 16-like n=1 Tax=Durio zibethinus TaxID=66656 RepID=A0A6P6A4B7_DURZI|nr:heavy metal-associated isoprenylated plant protein 16-like [Durio zibethinus]
MTQKIVVKVTMNGEKSRSKALQIVVGLSGVESASLKGDDKSQIEVTGDGFDPVKLTSKLRKSVGHTELVSVSAVGGEKKDEKKVENKDEVKPAAYVWPYNQPLYVYQELPSYGYAQHHDPCAIM